MTATTATAPPRLPMAVPLAIGVAWAAVIVTHTTDFAERYHHDLIGGHAPAMDALAGYSTIWAAMVAAMMLPTSAPLLRLFSAAAADQPRRATVLACFVVSYLAVWMLFGWVALAFDGGVHRTVHAVSWLHHRPWVVTAGTLGLAGAFQFSTLKDRCLTQCRHPAAFLLRHYRHGLGAAFRLGWGHGLHCLGCCWALMLVMFAVGITDLRWMALLGAVMAYEKIGRHGKQVAKVVGVIGLSLAVITVVWPGSVHLA